MPPKSADSPRFHAPLTAADEDGKELEIQARVSPRDTVAYDDGVVTILVQLAELF
jgi:hypothetical protein